MHGSEVALTCRMQRPRRRISIHGLVLSSLLVFVRPSFCLAQRRSEAVRKSEVSSPVVALLTARSLPSDLELGGELAGAPPGETRYITREQLLALPQLSYRVTDDTNFAGPTEVSGVSLAELARHLAASPKQDMTVAICDDQYRANFPRAYVVAHDPVLVLKVNGQPPSGWPKDTEFRSDMGPYMISQPKFTPSFTILGNADQPQIPWGVVRLEFRDEKAVFATIVPRPHRARDQLVQAGYRIARQNCFRCHNSGNEGGTKAQHPWLVLSAWATAAPGYFAAYIHNPQSNNPQAKMPGNPDYDDRTIAALEAYFRTFSTPCQPRREKP